MSRRLRLPRSLLYLIVSIGVAAACVPFFAPGSTVTVESAGSVITVQWPPALEVDDGEELDRYEVEVDGTVVGIVSPDTTMCVLSGLTPGLSYHIAVSAYDTAGEWSGSVTAPDYQDIFRPSTTYVAPAGAVAGPLSCDDGPDADGDRLPDVVETNTGTFVNSAATGTDPATADTDGDAIDDGDEVLGAGRLDLPGLGVSPVHRDVLLEFDWFDDNLDACAAHSHRPTPGAIARFEAPFETAPVANPDGTTGVNVISDYGQGGLFVGGNLIADPDGVIAGGVSGAEFLGYKAAHFAPERDGYFHYVLLPHRYNTTSSSSGQAELFGDDLIVSLYCFGSDHNVGTTTVHELGHNLGLRHGGFENRNYKPNYNSVMNYAYQFPGVDDDCFLGGDGRIDLSTGSRAALDENDLDESAGMCGGVAIDWNGDTVIAAGVVADINPPGSGDGSFTTLDDFDDWANLYFAGIGDADGAAPPTGEHRSHLRVELVSEQPVPLEYRNN